VLRPVWEATGGADGRVSIEVDPRIAHDTGRAVAEARALWRLVDRPNLFVQIPVPPSLHRRAGHAGPARGPGPYRVRWVGDTADCHQAPQPSQAAILAEVLQDTT
jgi:hypothetical protein